MAGKKLSQAKKQPDTAKKTYEYDDEALSAVERQLAEEDGLVYIKNNIVILLFILVVFFAR